MHELFAMADEAYQVSSAAVRGNLVNAALQDVATLPHKLGLTRRRDHRSEVASDVRCYRESSGKVSRANSAVLEISGRSRPLLSWWSLGFALD